MTARHLLDNRRRHEIVEFELDGIAYIAGFGRFPDGRLAELFLNTNKPGCAADTVARDAAIVTSLALQHGADIGTIRHALTRLKNGSAAGPVGVAIDLIEAAP